MKAWYATEDGLAVWLGLIVVALALPSAVGVDLLGWLAAPQVWLEASKAAQPISRAYDGLPGFVSVLATYVFVLSIASAGLSSWGLRSAGFSPVSR